MSRNVFPTGQFTCWIVRRATEGTTKASPERARDIAYSLAVFKVDYQTNRDYLWSSLNSCLSRPKESPEDGVCDGDLFSFIANLYWRGDSALLVPLLQVAESRRDVIDDIGRFYADLLDRRGVVALSALGELCGAKQQLVCRLADEDDLKMDSPKREGIITFLRGTRDEAATQCLRALGDHSRLISSARVAASLTRRFRKC